MAEDRVKLIIELDDNASGGLSRLSGTLRNIQGPVKQAESAFSSFGARIIVLNQGLELARRAWDLLDRSLGAVIRTSDRFRRLNLRLESLTGSTEGAADAMGFLINLAKRTPQTLAVLTDGFIKLTAGGVDAKAGMVALTDAVAAFGGSDQELIRATIAIQQMGGKGVISMEELRRQLGEAVPTAMKIMARELGVSMKVMIDLISQGGLDAQTGINALIAGFQKDFSGRALKMMDTWQGATSNLADSWALFLKALGETGILDAAIKTVQTLTGAINALNKALMVSRGVGNFGDDLESLDEAVDGVRARMVALDGAAQANIITLKESSKEFAELEEKLKNLLTQREKIVAIRLAKSLETEAEAAKKLADKSQALKDRMQELVKSKGNATQAAKALAKALDGATDELTGMEAALVDVERELQKTAKTAQLAADEAFEKAFREAIQGSTDDLTGFEAALVDVEREIQRVKAAADKSKKSLDKMISEKLTGLLDAVLAKLGALGTAFSTFLQLSAAGADPLTAGGTALAELGINLLLANERFSAAIDKINETLAMLIDPIAEAIAPSLEAIAPVLVSLQPVFETIGALLKIYIDATLANSRVIREATRAMERIQFGLDKVNAQATRIWQQVQAFFTQFRIDLETFFNGLGTDIAGKIGDLLEKIPGSEWLQKTATKIREEIIEALKSLEELPGKMAELLNSFLINLGILFGNIIREIASAIFDAIKSALSGGSLSVSVGPVKFKAHEGGLIQRENLTPFPGSQPGEGLIVAEEGETVVARDGTVEGGQGGGITINIFGQPDVNALDNLVRVLEEQMSLGRLASI